MTEKEVRELFESAFQVREKSRIEKLEVRSSRDVFGEKAKSDRDVLVVHTTHGKEAHPIAKGLKFENGEWKVVDKLSAIRSLRNSNSWLSKFYKKYNSLPKVGLEVEVFVNNRGFITIVV